MKHNLFALLVCTALALLAALAPAGVALPEVQAASSSVTNDPAGDLAVFSQDFTGMSEVPGNVCLASEVGGGYMENVTLSYSGADHCVSFDGTQGALGRLFVGGLSPSLSTTLSFEMALGRSEEHATINVFAGGAWLAIRVLDDTPTDDLLITSCYYNPTLSYSSVTQDLGFSTNGRFKISITANSVTRINRIYLNDVEKLATPFTGYRESAPITLYDQFVNPFMFFSFDSIYPGQSACLQLYSIEQTVPQYSYVTPVSNPRVTSFGVDGPHAWDTVDTGLSLVGGGTIWADPTFIDDYSLSDLAELKALIADGWELGIHFSARLSDLPLADALSLMYNETADVAGVFGQAPTTWCSLQGGDNATHAEYAYTHLGLLSRNGLNGSGAGLTNVGNLGENCWGFWSLVSAAGVVIPSFTHELDISPAIPYSISPDNFTIFVSNYADNGIEFVGFREYWEKAQNSYHTTVSGLVSDPGVSLSFTVANMGGQSRLLVNAPWAAAVLDGSGGHVPYDVCDAGIVIEVPNGTYTVASAPRPDFSVDHQLVVVGQAVQFTNLSTGGLAPLAWEWDFGDGSVSSLQAPSHTYSSAGTFTVMLQVTDFAATSVNETRTGYITVAVPLTVTTSAATALGESSASLNGNLAAVGLADNVSVFFEWGATDGYGNVTAAQSMTAAGTFTAGLTGLAGSTTYHFRSRATDGSLEASGADFTFTTTPAVPPDTAPPVISPPSAEAMEDGATILWSTDEAATSQVEFGPTEEYGEATTIDPALATRHSVELTGLEAGRTYHFRVISRDAAGNEAASADDTFTTEAKAGGWNPARAWLLISVAAIGGLGTAAFVGWKLTRD